MEITIITIGFNSLEENIRFGLLFDKINVKREDAKYEKILKLVIIILALAFISPIATKPIETEAASGYWVQDSKGWRYFKGYYWGYAYGW